MANKSEDEIAFKAIAKIASMTKDKHAHLRAACNYLTENIKNPTAWAKLYPDQHANAVFFPLKLACECSEEPIVLVALRALQHLVSQGWFDASVAFVPPPVPVPVKKKGLFGLGGGAAEVASPSVDADGKSQIPGLLVTAVAVNMRSQTEELQMEICRTLLTAVSAPQLHLHGKPLLLAVNACFGIYLHGRALAAATAKAALSQMGGLILQRAEHDDDDTSLNSSRRAMGSIPPEAVASAPNGAVVGEVPNATHDEGVTTVAHTDADNAEGVDGNAVGTVMNADEVIDELSPSPQRLNDEVDTTDAISGGGVADTEEDGTIKGNASLAGSIATHLRTESTVDSGSNNDTANNAAASTDFLTSSERDIYLLLKSLSAICGKPLENPVPESPDFRGRLQCLSMLQHCITTASDELKQKRTFRLVLRQNVARSLLQNCTSTSVEIARVSLNSMQCLLCDLRQYLKAETQVFLQNIVLPILESPHSSYDSRLAALHVLQALFSTGQMVMDLFTNFDCSIGSVNLIADAMNRVTKCIQTSHVAPNWITPRQDEELRMHGVRVLSAISKGMVGWIGHLREAQKGSTTTTNAVEGDEATVGNEGEKADSGGAADDVDRMLREKRTFEAIVETFNRKKAKDGIALAHREGIIKNLEDPEEIAKFMLTTKGLNKMRIGEFLAANQPFIKDVLTSFIGQFDFSGLEVDEAMRLFLGKFKIQGEAETVDRTMETFATHYCHHNPDAFSSASTCYVLSFAIIMLNTDAHSVHIKEKMSLQGFLQTTRGIDDGKNLASAFLEGIYTRITTNEIVLEDAPPKAPATNVGGAHGREEDSIFQSLAQKKAQSYRREADSLVRDSIQQLASEDAKSTTGAAADGGLGVDGAADGASSSPASTYITASSIFVARAFWEMAWVGMLPSIAVPMEQSAYEPLIDACIEGFDSAISLSCIFGDSTEREAFVSSLAAFTYATSRREMEYKNIAAVRTLLRVAQREGNSLQGAWYDVLKCVSLIEKTRGASEGALHVDGHRGPNAASGVPVVTAQQQHLRLQQRRFETFNASVIASNFDAVEFDRIYSRSGDLEGAAVVSLVEAMCRVSAEELAETAPRTHTLQRLVEVTEINIGRLRYVWSQMWVHLSKHFISVGVSKQQLVALFVVDSLRQLSIKFLSRDELGSIGFQRDFLKPFEVICSSTPRNDVRELVIASLGQMVDARASNIHSGWHGLLNTLGKCASSAQPSVVGGAAFVLQRITLRFLHLLETSELLTDIVNAWSMFGGNITDLLLAKASVRFIRLLGVFAGQGIPPANSGYFTATAEIDAELQHKAKISKRPVFATVETLDRITAIQFASAAASVVEEGSEQHGDRQAPADTFADLRTWLSVFSALSSLTSVQNFAIRNDSLTTLFTTIRDHVAVFSPEDWDMILGGTVQPIFENLFCDIVMLEEEHRDMEQCRTRTPQTEEDYRSDRKNQIKMLELGLDLLTDLFVDENKHLGRHLPDLLSVLIGCTSKKDPQVTNAGLGKLQRLITAAPATAFLTQDHWDLIVRSVKEDFSSKKEVLRKMEISLTPAKIHTTTSTLHALARYLMVFGASLQTTPCELPGNVIIEWMNLFMGCHRAVSAVLDNPSISAILHNLVTGRIILDTQRESCKGLALCFGRVSGAREQGIMEEWVRGILHRLASISPTNREYDVIHEVVTMLLKVILKMDDATFKPIVELTYGSLCYLVGTADPELCRYLSGIFVRVGAVHGFYQPTSQDTAALEGLTADEAPHIDPPGGDAADNVQVESDDDDNSVTSNPAESVQQTLIPVSPPGQDSPLSSPVRPTEPSTGTAAEQQDSTGETAPRTAPPPEQQQSTTANNTNENVIPQIAASSACNSQDTTPIEPMCPSSANGEVHEVKQGDCGEVDNEGAGDDVGPFMQQIRDANQEEVEPSLDEGERFLVDDGAELTTDTAAAVAEVIRTASEGKPRAGRGRKNRH